MSFNNCLLTVKVGTPLFLLPNNERIWTSYFAVNNIINYLFKFWLHFSMYTSNFQPKIFNLDIFNCVLDLVVMFYVQLFELTFKSIFTAGFSLVIVPYSFCCGVYYKYLYINIMIYQSQLITNSQSSTSVSI